MVKISLASGEKRSLSWCRCTRDVQRGFAPGHSKPICLWTALVSGSSCSFADAASFACRRSAPATPPPPSSVPWCSIPHALLHKLREKGSSCALWFFCWPWISHAPVHQSCNAIHGAGAVAPGSRGLSCLQVALSMHSYFFLCTRAV